MALAAVQVRKSTISPVAYGCSETNERLRAFAAVVAASHESSSVSPATLANDRPPPTPGITSRKATNVNSRNPIVTSASTKPTNVSATANPIASSGLRAARRPSAAAHPARPAMPSHRAASPRP